MQSENRMFDDFVKFVNGVAGTAAGMGREAQSAFRDRARDFVGDMDFVSREEFDAVKEMAAKARTEADALAARVAALEAAAGLSAAPHAQAGPDTTQPEAPSTRARRAAPKKDGPGKKA